MAASALYSVLTDEWEIVCLLDFQETNESRMKIQKLVVDFHVSLQEPQSASKNARSLMFESNLKMDEKRRRGLGQDSFTNNEEDNKLL